MRKRWIGIIVCSSPWLHSRAINLLRNLFSCHDFDQRLTLNDEKTNRNRVARLYLPLIHIISANLNKLFDPGNASFGTPPISSLLLTLSLSSSGQLNRPSVSVTSPDELLTGTSDDLTTENDGTLVNKLDDCE